MTTRVAANRANSRASTGPKTKAGKAKVARNALRHGLAAAGLALPGHPAEAMALARDIARAHRTPAHLAAAVRIAEAQIDLRRVRLVRSELMERLLAAAQSAGERTLTHPESPAPASLPFATGLRQLTALDRYERRARARRKFAIRDFDRTCADLRPGKEER